MIKHFSKESVIYEGSERHIWVKEGLVYKYAPDWCNEEWKSKASKLLSSYFTYPFHSFIKQGYITHLIDGTDLHGNQIFTMDNTKVKCILPDSRKYEVCNIFSLAISAGKELGYTFGDITCGNILDDGKGLYLIDFEGIVPYPLSPDYIHIWNNTLKIVFGD